MSISDPVAAFLDAMESAGMKPAEPIAGRLGKGLVRFQCDGDRKGRRNGWAVLHLDGTPAGAFGHYVLGISRTWRAQSSRRLSREERAALHREIEKARLQREAETLAAQEETAIRCERIWSTAAPVDQEHPYLVRKRASGEGLRQRGDFLLVPMCDPAGKVWNLQRIAPDGAKRFMKGGRQKGLYLVIGEPSDTLLIAEGYSTSASLRQATGHAVVVAFSKDNLKATAISIQDRWPNSAIIICADDDAHLEVHPRILKNLGVEAAHDAARAVGGRVAIPPRSLSHD